MVHRKLDPYSRARDAARDLARVDPRNQRLHQARDLLDYLPGAALFPLQAETLLLLAVLGVGIWLGSAGLTGIWLLLPMVAALMTYLLEVVAHAANGYGAPPPFSALHFGRLGEALLALLPVVTVIAAVKVAEQSGPPLLAWLVLLCGASALPAILVTFAIERALAPALDPRRWWALLSAAGGSYMAIVALLALWLAAGLSGPDGAMVASDAIGSTARMTALPGIVLGVYLALAAAHLLGALLFLRRDALGLAVALEPRSDLEESNESLQESVARLLKLADLEEHHGRDAAAVALLTTAAFGSHAARPWLEELFDGACRRPKPYFAEAAGQRLVAHLVATKQWARALEVVVHATQRWWAFQPGSPDERVQLAAQALERGDALAFRQLSRDLEALGAAPQRVDLAFLAARWCAERDRDPAAARRLLAPLLARTEHPAHRRIAAFDAALSG